MKLTRPAPPPPQTAVLHPAGNRVAPEKKRTRILNTRTKQLKKYSFSCYRNTFAPKVAPAPCSTSSGEPPHSEYVIFRIIFTSEYSINYLIICKKKPSHGVRMGNFSTEFLYPSMNVNICTTIGTKTKQNKIR